MMHSSFSSLLSDKLNKEQSRQPPRLREVDLQITMITWSFLHALNGRRDWIKSEYKLSFSNLSFICYAVVPCRSLGWSGLPKGLTQSRGCHSSLPHSEAWWRKKTRMILLLILLSTELSTNLNRSKKVISYFIVQILQYIPVPLS